MSVRVLPPPLIPPFLAPLAVHVAGCPERVSLGLACWYAIPRSLCFPRARSGFPSSARPVLPCPAVFALRVTRGLRAAPVQGAGRPVPGSPCPSVFPARVPCSACLVWRGLTWSPCLPAWLRVLRPHGGQPMWPGPPCSFFALSGVGHSASSDGPSLGRAAGACCPSFLGRRAWGLGGPSQTRQRTLFRARFARCGGGTRASGWAPRASVRGVRAWALSLHQTTHPWGRWPVPSALFPWAAGCVGMGA